MSYQIGTVTLPKTPSRIVHLLPSINESFKITGGTAIAIGLGLDIEKLTLDIVLNEQDYTIEQLAGSYLTPLKNYLNTEVALSFPLSFHNGTWLMTELQPTVTVSSPNRIFVSIKFVRGSDIEIF